RVCALRGGGARATKGGDLGRAAERQLCATVDVSGLPLRELDVVGHRSLRHGQVRLLDAGAQRLAWRRAVASSDIVARDGVDDVATTAVAASDVRDDVVRRLAVL